MDVGSRNWIFLLDPPIPNLGIFIASISFFGLRVEFEEKEGTWMVLELGPLHLKEVCQHFKEV